jgi:hypothetical protein
MAAKRPLILDADAPRDLRPPPGLGSFEELSAFVPDALRPHVVIRTPLGVVVIDPLASSQDDTTQRLLQSLGIEAEIIVGPVPESVLAQAAAEPLGRNLALLAAGVVGLWLWSRR